MIFPLRDTSDLARAIRTMRRERQLTQMQLAQRAGVGRQWISDVESGKSTLRFSTVLTLLDALDVDLAIQPRAKPSIDLDDLLGLDSHDD